MISCLELETPTLAKCRQSQARLGSDPGVRLDGSPTALDRHELGVDGRGTQNRRI